MPCTDSCVPFCQNCSPNGFCAGSINIDASVNYFCKCKDGYTGDGHTCTPNTCTANWQCQSPTYSTTCTNGICQCANSFEWNTTTAAQQAGAVCACNSSSTLYWNGNVAECIPIGRCRQRWQCPQDYNSVTCIQYGQNAFIPYDTCVCNFGFDGIILLKYTNRKKVAFRYLVVVMLLAVNALCGVHYMLVLFVFYYFSNCI